MLQVGPGHCSVVSTGDSGDQWWMVYHAWVHGHTDQEPGRWETVDIMHAHLNSHWQKWQWQLQAMIFYFYFRQLLMDKVEWRGGWPVVGSPSSAKQLKPSVDNEV